MGGILFLHPMTGGREGKDKRSRGEGEGDERKSGAIDSAAKIGEAPGGEGENALYFYIEGLLVGKRRTAMNLKWHGVTQIKEG